VLGRVPITKVLRKCGNGSAHAAVAKYETAAAQLVMRWPAAAAGSGSKKTYNPLRRLPTAPMILATTMAARALLRSALAAPRASRAARGKRTKAWELADGLAKPLAADIVTVGRPVLRQVRRRRRRRRRRRLVPHAGATAARNSGAHAHSTFLKEAEEVPESMYGSPELLELVQQMVDTMRAAPGVGLAAPQIGIPLRVRCSCMIGGAGCCKWKTESGAKHHAVGRRCSTCSCLHLVLSPADGPTRPEHVAAVYLPVCPFLTSPALTPSSPPGYRAGGPTQAHCTSPHAFASF